MFFHKFGTLLHRVVIVTRPLFAVFMNAFDAIVFSPPHQEICADPGTPRAMTWSCRSDPPRRPVMESFLGMLATDYRLKGGDFSLSMITTIHPPH